MELYYLNKEENVSDVALLYAVFKIEPIFMKCGMDLSTITDDSIVVMMPDYDNYNRCRKELSERNIYVISFVRDNLSSPICINRTLIISEKIGFSSLFNAIKILGIKDQNRKKQKKQSGFYWGNTKAMQEVKELADKAKGNNVSVHINGETGSGKTMLASYIAEEKKLIRLNCSCLDSSLAMDSLFGHIKGAFTGADSDREGLCRQADGNILFLDELQDLPYAVQSILLKVLENGTMRPLGSDKEVKVSFKLITASSLTTEELERKIRKDLLSRIGIITLTLPPLRERKEDIPILIKKRITELTKRSKKYKLPDLNPWINHSWQGNIRELYSKLEYTFTVGKTPKEMGEEKIEEVKETVMKLPSLKELKMRTL